MKKEIIITIEGQDEESINEKLNYVISQIKEGFEIGSSWIEDHEGYNYLVKTDYKICRLCGRSTNRWTDICQNCCNEIMK